jgi:hypothetical protein
MVSARPVPAPAFTYNAQEHEVESSGVLTDGIGGKPRDESPSPDVPADDGSDRIDPSIVESRIVAADMCRTKSEDARQVAIRSEPRDW